MEINKSHIMFKRTLLFSICLVTAIPFAQADGDLCFVLNIKDNKDLYLGASSEYYALNIIRISSKR
jgi:hypothetical protein